MEHEQSLETAAAATRKALHEKSIELEKVVVFWSISYVEEVNRRNSREARPAREARAQEQIERRAFEQLARAVRRYTAAAAAAGNYVQPKEAVGAHAASGGRREADAGLDLFNSQGRESS